MEELTLSDASLLFIQQYKIDPPEMRLWLEKLVRDGVLASFAQKRINKVEFEAANLRTEELIKRARAAVEGVKADA